MTEEEKNSIANQIGNIGGNNAEQNAPQITGQKLKMKQKRNAITEEDEAQMDAIFNKQLGGVKIIQTGKSEIGSAELTDIGENAIGKGWIPLDREGMKDRSIFYPADWEFRVKPAGIEITKNWSQINENDENKQRLQLQIWNIFNEIVKKCVTIKTPTGILNWTHINSWDRFWFVKRVHDYSYANAGKIEFTDECENCGEEITFTLEADKLAFDMPDESVIDKHWDVIENCWKIDPKEYDINRPIIKLYTPTMGKDDIIVQWAYAQNQMGKKTDDTFLKFLPWLMKTAPKDIKLADKMIKELERQFKTWDEDFFDFMDEVIKNINVSPEEQLTTTCPNCGVEVHSTVQFQNGVKSLFTMEVRHKKFGTK